MSRSDYPFIDPHSCPDDPARPGKKLCPRCSKQGQTCCVIVPHSNIYETGLQIEISERESAADFPNEDDYQKFNWLCKGSCNQDGEHNYRDPRRKNDQHFIEG